MPLRGENGAGGVRERLQDGAGGATDRSEGSRMKSDGRMRSDELLCHSARWS